MNNEVLNHALSRADVERLKRTLTATAVTGVLEQPDVQKEIAGLMDYLNPWRQSVPRLTGTSSAWLLDRRSVGTTIAQFVNDIEEPDEDVSSYARVSFVYKTILARGKVTRKARAIGRSFRDILMDEIRYRVEDVRDYEEHWSIWGDAAQDAKQFSGMNKLITDAQKVAQSTGVMNGATLTLAKMDQAIDRNRGNPSLILVSRAFRRLLAAKLQSQQRWIDHTEIAAGFKVMTYNGIPVLPTTNIPDTIFYSGSATPTQAQAVGGTGTTSMAFIVDFDNLWMGVLSEFQTQALSNKSSQYEEFDMFMDEALVLFNTLKISALYGVKIS
ncbi:hypothetical protein LCGC14_1220680 [marine sediment metagenome]|uniref:Phage major capsid protein n=1 Tax=marine sediment metagenome TaxID=412755 RepID=A0A0F9PFV0_9ZZZZ